MRTDIIVTIVLIVYAALWIVFFYIVYLVIKALKVYIRSKEVRQEMAVVKKTLGETIKAYRMERNMTQEFVAESLGVSRQAVSKWEMGTSDPSTSNLLALAKLYGVSAEELLGCIKTE
ncbi:MAG: helix-turn-helix domain-containing protein [Anaerotignum sp.]|nr:helix-turn-helix domain-containing protein [Anaerotignum sp.]MBQ7085294.1 helix-turn-helix domain-containing protein [Anaerotignum sp.]MBR2062894.1 helix-turn-helix domain-containing protein [Anaerotignum sp.]